MSRRKPSLKKVAYHEAGHALVACHFGDDLVEITIDPQIAHAHGRMARSVNKESLGASPDPAAMAEAITRGVIKTTSICLGGVVAEYICNGEPKKARGIYGGGLDMYQARDIFRRVADLSVKFDPEEAMRAVFDNVVTLLKSKWPAVKAVADALVQKDTVDGKEATRIIEGGLQ